MAHWCETYPHNIYASVILKDNKIKLWKVGQYRLCEKFDIQGLISTHKNYSYEEKSFVVNNNTEHNAVFERLSTDWFSQWELHEDYVGMNPFEETLKASN